MVQTPFDATRLVVIENFFIPQLNSHRTVRIYLPQGYQCETSLRYPVLYMHDGQNMIDPALSYGGQTWRAPEILDQLQRDGQSNGILLVCVDNNTDYEGARMDEYSPWPCEKMVHLGTREHANNHKGGKGAQYINFIVETLKPYIDAHYRTLADRDHTVIAGSSMGGHISLYALLQHSETFHFAGVFSPAFWFSENAMAAFIEQAQCPYPVGIYMDMGTRESSNHDIGHFPQVYLNGARRMQRLLEQKDASIALRYDEIALAVHNEAAWAERFPAFLCDAFRLQSSC
uniref:alpha/beta hydrolase n=1 Tax=Thaumasiovibrio occultus TaxID=1891184 RepID=UPI000B3599A0|nr:alpha/beta hydrolase-fold protein [Thaumasiovibrio occultus]